MNTSEMVDRIETERLVLFPYTQENLSLFNEDLPAFEERFGVLYRGEELDYLLRGFLLKLEREKRAAELAARKPAVGKASSSSYIIYKVRKGDVLGRIAQRHHVTVRQLKKWNNLKGDFIREGQKLKIYKS